MSNKISWTRTASLETGELPLESAPPAPPSSSTPINKHQYIALYHYLGKYQNRKH